MDRVGGVPTFPSYRSLTHALTPLVQAACSFLLGLEVGRSLHLYQQSRGFSHCLEASCDRLGWSLLVYQARTSRIILLRSDQQRWLTLGTVRALTGVTRRSFKDLPIEVAVDGVHLVCWATRKNWIGPWTGLPSGFRSESH